jgi:putative spermidine/putrescine transport system ATP-binding protein
MSPIVLELADVTKRYGGIAAVERVSLQLANGEFLSLLGPSGSGKTTTLQMIAGLAQPSSGEIFLSGRPIGPLPPYKRDIGMVFQNYALFPHMTVARNIAFPLEMRNAARSEIAHRVESVLRLVDLPGLGDRLPKQLSGGQQQRVALARAIVFEPKLLLMDEPLGALDKRLREQMQLEIKHLHKRLGISIIYVTHDQDEALVMSDRIGVFNRGRLEQIGPVEELYERPSTRFVAEFIGETNTISGKLGAAEGGYAVLETADGPLRGRSQAVLATGSGAALSIRPERIRLETSEVPASVRNCLSGRIVEAIYIGRGRKYVIETASGARLTAAQQAAGAHTTPHSAGEQVTVLFAAEDAVIIVDAG